MVKRNKRNIFDDILLIGSKDHKSLQYIISKLILSLKQAYLMNHAKALSCQFYSAGNSNQNSHAQYLKYLVVDSENEDEQIFKRDKDIIYTPNNQLNPPILQINSTHYVPNKHSNIIRHKSTVLSNITNNNNHLYYQDSHHIDQQIFKTQNQVNNLERQCCLLQKLIQDMIKQQAQIKMQIRIKERGRMANKQISLEKKKDCPIHSKNNSRCCQHMQEFRVLTNVVQPKNIKSKLHPSFPQLIQNSTVLLSKQLSPSKEISQKPSKELKISTVKSKNTNLYKNTQNISPVKKSISKKQPWNSNFKDKKKQKRSKSIMIDISKIKKAL